MKKILETISLFFIRYGIAGATMASYHGSFEAVVPYAAKEMSMNK